MGFATPSCLFKLYHEFGRYRLRTSESIARAALNISAISVFCQIKAQCKGLYPHNFPALLGSAPAFRSTLNTLGCSIAEATQSGVTPPSCCQSQFGSAPLSMRSWAISPRPSLAAQYRGVSCLLALFRCN